jgi:hypothetical protein
VNTNTTIPADLVGYTLISGEGQEVGSISDVWPGADGKPEFAGVHVGLLAGTHLVPLSVAHIDPGQRVVRVDAMKDTIENTRRFSPGDKLSSQDRWETYDDWGLKAPEPGAPTPHHADLQEQATESDGAGAESPVNPV